MKKKLHVMMFMLAVLAFGVTQVLSQSVVPVLIAGNISCSDLGYDFGFKPQPEPPPSGTYAFPDGIDELTISSDGTYFNWTSTLGLDAVIVKGGSNINSYVYQPPAESYGDNGLHAPINPSNSTPFAISHIEVCYDYEVDVSKTAETSFTRTYEWTIDKSVSPDTWDLFNGDDGTSEYTVTVDKTTTDSDWAVSGEITVSNNTPLDATITDIADVISAGINASVDCGVTFPYTLASGATLTCSYSADLPDAASRINTATVTTSGDVGGGSATADVTFGEPTIVGYNEINITDSNGSSWGPVSDDASWSYKRTFTCGADAGTKTNTATIVETGHSDDASVKVNCYALEVSKTAETSLDRTWSWTIDKTANQTELTLSTGQIFTVNYEVIVDATFLDDNWAVNGYITVSNPAPMGALITDLKDVLSPGVSASVDCGVTFPYTLPAGGSITCTYSKELPDATDRTNTASATQKNYSYASDGSATASGTTDYDGSADVDFADATITETDECIDVTDTYAGSLGTVCADAAPVTFSYFRDLSYENCGDYTVENTASFVTKDRGITGSDSWTVKVKVPCEVGCTLTPGYWKTHNASFMGGASKKADDTWEYILPSAEMSPFFLSGQTYYEVLWTSPAGNVYYILASPFIAAELNMLNGASIPTAVQDAFNAAKSLFEAYTPAAAGALKGKDKKNWTDLAMILDDYNNGYTGPGHCSEEEEAEIEVTTYTKGAIVQQPVTPEEILLEAYPNPFGNELNFRIVLPYESRMVLELFNMVGQKLAVLHDHVVEAGQVVDVNVQASELPAQTLIYRLSTSQEVLTGKILPMSR